LLFRKFLIIFIIIGLLCLSCLVILNKNLVVEAASEEETIEIDYQFIYNITFDLSNVINEAYNKTDIPKGRGYGTKGEEYARDIILVPEMSNLDLFNPPSLDKPYLDEITNRWYRFKNIANGRENLTDKITIHEKRLTINDTVNNTTFEVDCYIRPLTNGTRLGPEFEKKNKEINENLTYNFTGKGLKIYTKPTIR
jgi:hypothetical protein